VVLPIIFLCVGLGLGALIVALAVSSTKRVTPTPTPIVTNVEQPATNTEPTTTEPVVVLPQPTTDVTLITINWITPKKVDFNKLLPATPLAGHFSTKNSEDPSQAVVMKAIWERGTVKDGKYKDYTLYWFDVACQGMCFAGEDGYIQILISPDNKKIIALTGSEEIDALVNQGIITLDNVRVANVTVPPKTLTLTNGKTIYKTGGIGTFQECSPTACGLKRLDISKEGFAVLEHDSGSGCLFVINELGIGTGYISLIKPNDPAANIASPIQSSIKWTKPYEKAGDVFYAPQPPTSGCGSGGGRCANIVYNDSVGPTTGLVQAGTTNSGDPTYVPKNPSTHALVQAAYEGWMGYGEVGGTAEKPSIAEFLKKYPAPIFFWKDAFGQWVEYTLTDIKPTAECGKPVIYLYPPKTTDVSVRLPSFINVTKSEPTYPEKGWDVTAEPNGTLTMKDGSTFGSLFWEGTGVGYEKPTEGFVVKDGNVDAFLTKTLAKYGLNAQEAKEFKDFWVPKMVGAPYYRVSFLTSAWSKAAPLGVTPRPDTNIRIFMDWQKLSSPISIKEPTIVTPVRSGFTLVEWGGLL
jgi:hypothetical protein